MTGPLSLPADGTLQILVICACLSLLMLGLTAVVQVRERQWPEARWAAIPLLLAVAAGLSSHALSRW